MTYRYQLYKCPICGTVTEIVHDGVSAMICCGKTMEVLNGISVSLENIRVAVYLPRYVGGSLKQKVVITVHTSYQTASQLRSVERIHQHHFLTLGQ